MTVFEHGHLTEDAIEAYSMRRLPAPDCEPLEEHLLLCPDCQDRLEKMDAFIAAFKAASAGMRQDSMLGEPGLSFTQRIRRSLLSLWQAFTPAYALGGAVVAAALVIAILPRTPAPTAAPAVVELNAIRGMVPVVAPSGAPLHLSLDLTGLPPAENLRVELANSSGKILWNTTTARPDAGKLNVQPTFQPGPGLYWVRIYNTAGAQPLLREFGLRLGN